MDYRDKANIWYKDNVNNIDKSIMLTDKKLPPGIENLLYPGLWRPEHWKWFLDKGRKNG